MATSKKEERLDDYILGMTLGRGLTSKVVLGTHSSSGELVALKILNKSRIKQSQRLQRALKSEITALKKVKHPHVLKLIASNMEAQLEDGEPAPYIALELAPNGELLDYLLYTGSFSHEVARTYFSQLMSGVRACHDAGIVHRDLKPDNLLLDANFQLKLADFGFASTAQDMMHTYTGTRAYMAPEVFMSVQSSDDKGDGYDKACDIWSCGVILFIMSTGCPPYQEPGKRDWWFRQLQAGKFSLFWKAHETQNRPFDPEFKEIIEGMLSVGSSKRWKMPAIEKAKWLTEGKTLSAEALKKRLSQKKTIVDSEQESERKKIESFEEKSTEDDVSSANSRTTTRMRSLRRRSSSLSPTSVKRKISSSLDSKSLPAPPSYRDVAVRCYTRMKLPCSPQMLLGRVLEVLVRMGSGVRYSREGYRLEVRLPVSGGNADMVLAIEVYLDDEDGGDGDDDGPAARAAVATLPPKPSSAVSKMEERGKGAAIANHSKGGDSNNTGSNQVHESSSAASTRRSMASVALVRRLRGPWTEFRKVFLHLSQSLCARR